MRLICAALAVLAILAVPRHSGSADFFAGGEADTKEQSFYYLGMTASKKAGGDISYAGRVFLSDLRYSFESGQKVSRVTSPGATLSAGLKFEQGSLLLAGYAGLDMRNKETADDAGVAERDSLFGGSIAAEVYAFGENQSSLSIIANYSTIDGFVWFRARAKRGILSFGRGMQLISGLEGAAMGNSDTAAFQAGGLMEINNPASNLSVLIKAGLKESSGVGDSLYYGFEIYRPF